MPIGQAKFGLLGGVVDPGKLELIETVNASAVSSFDFSTLGTYNVHFLTYNDLFNSSNDKGFGIRLYESGVLETASVYQLALTIWFIKW